MSDYEEENFADDLENDFDDFSEVGDEVKEIQDEIMSVPIGEVDSNKEPDHSTILEIIESLEKLLRSHKQFNMSKYDITTINPRDISDILAVTNQVERLITNVTVKLEEVHTLLNEISPIISDDIYQMRQYMKLLYSEKFDELDTLIPSTKHYSNVITLLENSSEEILNNETMLSQGLLNDCELSKEESLIVLMSMKTSFHKNVKLPTDIIQNLKLANKNILKLIRLQEQISEYISSKIESLAPNVSALVGPKVTSLLVAHAGGILGLSKIPSCNLASIGNKKHLGHVQNTTGSGIRQEGYISTTDIIQNLPIAYHKQMLRMVCAKVSLASRVDCSQRGNDKNGKMGLKWRSEIETKIKKLHESPNVTEDKALPIPEDKPKKKRAGRKFRKFKERFQLSHSRQSQNRMEFGKQESTMTDAFGEEIGLGMLNPSVMKNRSETGRVAKMSKKMKKRVQEADDQTKEYILSLNDDQL
ncbi:U4/U6-U5 snRNP complex subunit prp31 [Maudiozyma exigua]|uniref:U4/U6-U5 snRNP complex subunit prp31 n=1 Tax=Maudiozyma exigua TaxID=34358 RepID=A0A9P6WB74_MAUEX|nr:U4/U6-U5 snRNP complex subunit prp31 [Kazachstania exigua]